MDKMRFVIEIPFAMIRREGCDITIHIADDGVTVNQPARDPQPYLFKYIEQRADCLRALGRVRTADTYLSTLRSIQKFRKGEDIALCDLSAQMLTDYQNHLLACGVQMNTVSFYMRILRTVYRHAVAEHLIPDLQPFVSVYTGIAKTRKRALTSEEVLKVVACRPQDDCMSKARDLFLFSLYTRGMSMVDIFNLKQSDLYDGVLTYHRQKMGQRLQIAS